jgi:hypothetical protein
MGWSLGDAFKYIAESAAYISDTTSKNVSTAADAIKDSTSYVGNAASTITNTVAKSPDAQSAIAESVAASADEAATRAAGQTAVADAQSRLNSAKASILKAQDNALTKQASAAAGRTSNVLTGALGVNRSAENTSSVLLGGANADGARKMGVSNAPGDALLGGIKAIAGSVGARRRAA